MKAVATLCCICLWAAPGAVRALTVEPAPLEVLAAQASLIVHGEVVATTVEKLPGRTATLQTRVEIAPIRVTRGPIERLYDFVVPGGATSELVTMAPGVPQFQVGDEVVLLMTRRAGEWRPIGYSLGTLWVAPGGAVWQHAEPDTWWDAARDDLVASWLGAW